MKYSLNFSIKQLTVKESHGPRLQDPAKVAEMFSDIVPLAQEAFIVCTLSQKHQIIDRHMVTLGTLTASLVHPREVYRPALMDAAAAVLCVHNHPSGDTEPSDEDVAITKRLEKAGDLLGIRLLDHIIVGRNGYFSFVEAGRL